MSLKEIGRIAGVSKSTVSLALSGKAGVTRAKRQRITAIADTMGYRPQAAARALVRNRTEVIGFVSHKGTIRGAEWSAGILDGLISELQQRNWHVMHFRATPEEVVAPTMVLSRLVDGLVLSCSWIPPYLNEQLRRAMTIVIANPHGDIDCDTVGPDDVDGAKQAIRYLLKLGHRRIAYLGTSVESARYIHRNRWTGFVEAMSAAGLPVNPGGGLLGGPELLDNILSNTPPTAIMCFNDDVASKTIAALRARGLDVPGDVSVIGFDNMAYCSYMTPSLTTMALPWEKIGVTAARMIIKRLDEPDKAVEHVVLPETPVIRQSTASPRKK